jgi:hypothetical protein
MLGTTLTRVSLIVLLYALLDGVFLLLFLHWAIGVRV